MNLDFESIITNKPLAAAGGAFVALRAIPGATLLMKLVNFMVAFLCACYLGPMLIDVLSVSSLRIGGGVIFCAGAAGIVVLDAVTQGIKETPLGPFLANWLNVFSRKKGGDQ